MEINPTSSTPPVSQTSSVSPLAKYLDDMKAKNEELNQIYNDPNLSPEQKKEKIEDLKMEALKTYVEANSPLYTEAQTKAVNQAYDDFSSSADAKIDNLNSQIKDAGKARPFGM